MTTDSTTPAHRSLADVLTVPYNDGTGKLRAAYQIPWAVVHDVLGLPEPGVDAEGFTVLPSGTAEDDQILTAWLLDQGAASWVSAAPGWLDEFGWGVAGPAVGLTLFYVVEVNGDRSDTHAHPGTLKDAIEAAQPDAGDRLRYGVVEAPDAGAARLMTPARWEDVPQWRVLAAAT